MTKEQLLELATRLSFKLELDRFSDSGGQGQEFVSDPFIRFRHVLAPEHDRDFAVIIYEDELSPDNIVFDMFEEAIRNVGKYQMKQQFGKLMGM